MLRRITDWLDGWVREKAPEPKPGDARLIRGELPGFGLQCMGEDGKWRELGKNAEGQWEWIEVETNE